MDFAKIVTMNKFLIKFYCNLKNYIWKTDVFGIGNAKNGRYKNKNICIRQNINYEKRETRAERRRTQGLAVDKMLRGW